MTKQEALEGLEMYEKMCCIEPKKEWCAYDFRYKSYSKVIVPILVNRITNSENDPLRTIRAFEEELDELIGDSSKERTWRFCSLILTIVKEIRDWLG